MASHESEKYGISQGYWDSIREADRDMYRLVRPLRKSSYRVDYPLSRVEGMLEDFSKDAISMGGKLEINPDFQRGHVWSREKQVAYIEALFRGTAPRTLLFNCASWNGRNAEGDINAGDIVCIDGLQRLTAIREFMAGKFPVFGDKNLEDLKGTNFDPCRATTWTISMEMYDIANRADLLQFYIDLNRGGVVHTDEEIARVQVLLKEARQEPGVSKPTNAKRGKAVR